jgi:hypothetical protein
MKYLIWFTEGDQDIVHFFKTKEEMDLKVKEYMIKAEKDINNNEGRWPNWLYEFTTAKVIGEIAEYAYPSGSPYYKEFK